MNRRLFWKIFLPFWVAQALLLGALYLRVHYRITSEHPWWIQPERREMPVLADLAAQRFQEQGSAGLQQLLDNLSLPQRSRFWLVDPSGTRTFRTARFPIAFCAARRPPSKTKACTTLMKPTCWRHAPARRKGNIC